MALHRLSGPIEFTSPFVDDLDLALALPALRFRYSISISDMDVLLWRSGLRISPVRSTFFSYRNTLLALRTHTLSASTLRSRSLAYNVQWNMHFGFACVNSILSKNDTVVCHNLRFSGLRRHRVLFGLPLSLLHFYIPYPCTHHHPM